MNRRDLVRKLFALPAIAVMAPMPVVKSHHGRWDDVLAVSIEIDGDSDIPDEEMAIMHATLKELVREESGRDIPCCWCRGVRIRFHTTAGDADVETMVDAETEAASSEVAQ